MKGAAGDASVGAAGGTTTPLPQMLAEALRDTQPPTYEWGRVAEDNGIGIEWTSWAAALLASPALAPLLALVEAAEAWRDSWSRYDNNEGWAPHPGFLLNAVDAFRGSPDR